MRTGAVPDLRLSAALARIDELQAENIALRQQLQEADLSGRPGTMARVLHAAAQEFDVHPAVLLSPRRDAEATEVRQVVMFVGVARLRRAPSLVARCIHRDHSTVLHGVRKMTARIAANPDLAARVARVVAAAINQHIPEVQ